jgi:hypothetical protein
MIRTRGFFSTLLLASACQGDLSGPPGETDDDLDPNVPSTPTDFEPGDESGSCNLDALLPPEAYGRKVKTLLTGLPLTDGELTQLEADPEALRGLVGEWLATPEAERTLQQFFMTAFQQTGVNTDSLFYLMGRNVQSFGKFTAPNSAPTADLLNRNLKESFARTMVELDKQGEPFTAALTTERFMMTTAQLAFMAYTDDETVDDEGQREVRNTADDFDRFVLYRDEAAAPPFAQALDPSHANFGHFWHKELVDLPAACNVAATNTIDFGSIQAGDWRIQGNAVSPSFYVFSLLMGRHQGVARQGQTNCNTGASNQGKPLFQRQDFSDWRMVQVRRPTESERATVFYDLAALRGATELVVHTDRVGFLTTPGFFSTWMNNEDNSSRVTVNQALIVALGKSFEGQAVTDFSPTDLDAEHAPPDSECYGCHQTLDPMRDFYRASYTNFYGQQQDPERVDLEADFVFRGVTTKGNGIRDLAAILVDHPDFPKAWAHKLCYLANGAACEEGAALDLVVASFVDSGFDFGVLVRDLYSSPLVTGAACVDGASSGTGASIARRTIFCNELSHRLGIDDVCGLSSFKEEGSALQNGARDASSAIPDDSFARAEVAPVVITETSLFTRANAEATCVLVAQNSFEDLYEGETSEAATLQMVTQLMALPPSDERHAPALAILREHWAGALATGLTDRDAAESTFVLACMAPSIAGVGF